MDIRNSRCCAAGDLPTASCWHEGKEALIVSPFEKHRRTPLRGVRGSYLVCPLPPMAGTMPGQTPMGFQIGIQRVLKKKEGRRFPDSAPKDTVGCPSEQPWPYLTERPCLWQGPLLARFRWAFGSKSGKTSRMKKRLKECFSRKAYRTQAGRVGPPSGTQLGEIGATSRRWAG